MWKITETEKNSINFILKIEEKMRIQGLLGLQLENNACKLTRRKGWSK